MMEKWMGFFLFLLSFQQFVCDQCFLNLELVQFQNAYNVEIVDFFGDESVCCCDAGTCENSLDDFTPTTCSPGCDTYFVLISEDCQDIAPCPVIMQTDHIVDSPTTVNVSHKFFFDFNNSTTDPVDFEIMMRDVAGSSYDEIDEFNFMVPFPLGNQEEVLFGTRGIGTITLRYDIICIELDSCSASLTSEGTAVTNTLIESTSMTITITSTVMRSVSSDAMTIAATTRTITVTRTVLMNPSLEQVSEQQSSTASNSMAVIWMSLFILFLFSTIVALFILVYLMCLLKRKEGNSKDTSRADNVTLVQTNSLSTMDNPAYTSLEKRAVNPVYFSVNNAMSDETSAPMHYDYTKCGPDDAPDNGKFIYVETKKLDENGDSHTYETV